MVKSNRYGVHIPIIGMVTMVVVIIMTYLSYRMYIKRNSSIEAFTVSDSKKVSPLMFRTSFQKYDELSPFLKNHLEKCQKMNLGIHQIYFSDVDIETFIKNHYPQFWEDYDVLIPGAFKADLWRLLILYKFGGIYCDFGHLFLKPLDDVIDRENDELILVRDQKINGKYNAIHNAFIACYPRHPFIKHAIDDVIDNIRKRMYGKNPLDITGPRCLGKSLNKYMKKASSLSEFHTGYQSMLDGKLYILQLTYPYIHVSSINDESNRFIQTKFSGYKDIMYRQRKTPHYDVYWHKRMVYKNM